MNGGDCRGRSMHEPKPGCFWDETLHYGRCFFLLTLQIIIQLYFYKREQLTILILSFVSKMYAQKS